MKHTISVLVADEFGVLTRISGLFARRGFSIDSIAIGASEESGISRITMVLPGSNSLIQQIINQLYKLINVIEVKDITHLPCIERELVLLKIKAPASIRPKIIQIADIFRAKIVDFAHEALILEITGDPGKIAAIEKLLSEFDILEISRTGKISLIRESHVNTIFLRNQ